MGNRSQFGALVYLDERRAKKETQHSMFVHIAGGTVVGIELPRLGIPERAYVVYHHPEPGDANAFLCVGEYQRQAVRAVEVPFYESASALAI